MKKEDQDDFDFNEEIKTHPFRRFLQVTFGFIFLIAIIYLGGIYQANLLRPTSDKIEMESLEKKVASEDLEISVHWYVFNKVDSEKETHNQTERLLNNNNAIWNQAGISLETEGIGILSWSSAEVESFSRNPSGYVRSLPNWKENRINIFLVETLDGLNGVAYGGLDALSLAEYTSHFDFRTLAHEVGHVLGLSHTQDRGRLMSQGSFGTTLTLEEIDKARQNALRFKR